MEKYVAPALNLDGFNCPHCGAFSHQKWFGARYRDPVGNLRPVEDASVSFCQKCDAYALWQGSEMIFP